MGLLAKANRMKYEGYEIIATPEENGKVNVWVSFKKLGDQDFITDNYPESAEAIMQQIRAAIEVSLPQATE